MCYTTYKFSYEGFRLSIFARSSSISDYLCGYVELTNKEYKRLTKNRKYDNVIDNVNIPRLTYGEIDTNHMLEHEEGYVTIGIDTLQSYYINYGLCMDVKGMIINLIDIVEEVITRIGSRSKETVMKIDADLICTLDDKNEFPLEYISNKANEIIKTAIIEYKKSLDEFYHTCIEKGE